MIKDFVDKLADECQKNKVNYMIVVEDNGVHDSYCVMGESKLRELIDVLKKIQKEA